MLLWFLNLCIYKTQSSISTCVFVRVSGEEIGKVTGFLNLVVSSFYIV